MNDVKEYNAAEVVFDGQNVCEGISGISKVRFNESYIVIGDIEDVDELFAMYDLTVIGNINAEKVSVNGNLLVSGNIHSKNIQCSSKLICEGRINSEVLSVDTEVIAASIDVDEMETYGNVIAMSSINFEKKCSVDGNVLVAEGLSGTGEIIADNIVAVDYIDVDSDIKGNYFELATMFIKGNSSDTKNIEDNDINKILSEFYEDYQNRITQNEENEIKELLEGAAKIQCVSFTEIAFIFDEIVRISYQNKIDNLYDYLLVSYAAMVLPPKLISYETIEHVFSQFIKKAEIAELEFFVHNVGEFAFSLKAAEICFPENEEILDSIFSFIGLRYGTVKKQFEGVI